MPWTTLVRSQSRRPTIIRFQPRLALLACLLLSWSVGCKREPPPEPPATEVAGQGEKAALDSRGRSTKWYLQDEVYGDREMFKEPRIQFVWAAPDEPKDSIWSMKLDGSDVRRAVGPELLYSGEAKKLSSQPPVRSPDGRYVACVGEDAKGDQLRFLVDLKEKKVRTITKGYGAAIFNWTPDSKEVIFYSSLDLWQYSVGSGQLKQLPMIYSKELRLIDGGRRFFVLNDEFIEYYDRSGKKLKRIRLPFETGGSNALSPDGRTLSLSVYAKRLVVTIDNLEHPIRRDDFVYPYSAFGVDGKCLYYFAGSGLEMLELATNRVVSYDSFPGEPYPHDMSMIEPLGAR